MSVVIFLRNSIAELFASSQHHITYSLFELLEGGRNQFSQRNPKHILYASPPKRGCSVIHEVPADGRSFAGSLEEAPVTVNPFPISPAVPTLCLLQRLSNWLLSAFSAPASPWKLVGLSREDISRKSRVDPWEDSVIHSVKFYLHIELHLTIPVLRLLSSKGQGGKDFWWPS